MEMIKYKVRQWQLVWIFHKALLIDRYVYDHIEHYLQIVMGNISRIR